MSADKFDDLAAGDPRRSRDFDRRNFVNFGVSGPATAWLRQNRHRAQRPLLVSCVTAAEFLTGCDDFPSGLDFLNRYIPQDIGYQQAKQCAELQRRARKAGKRFGENDAWQIAFAECAGASIVGRDRKSFPHLGGRYERLPDPA